MYKNIRILMTTDNRVELQKYLFSQGNYWIDEDGSMNTLKFGIDVYIEIDNYGVMTYRQLHEINVIKPTTVMNFIKTISYSLEEVREKISIGGKEYYKDDLEVALKNIKPI